MSKRNIELLYGVAYKSLFRIDGKLSYDRIAEALIRLCEVLKATDNDEFIWDGIGEFNECTLGDLIVGAYWHYTEWHAGQWSLGYRALSALGGIFSPGLSSIEDEKDGGSYGAYEQLNKMAEEATKHEQHA